MICAEVARNGMLAKVCYGSELHVPTPAAETRVVSRTDDPSAATLHGRLKIHLNRGADVSVICVRAELWQPDLAWRRFPVLVPVGPSRPHLRY